MTTTATAASTTNSSSQRESPISNKHTFTTLLNDGNSMGNIHTDKHQMDGDMITTAMDRQQEGRRLFLVKQKSHPHCSSSHLAGHPKRPKLTSKQQSQPQMISGKKISIPRMTPSRSVKDPRLNECIATTGKKKMKTVAKRKLFMDGSVTESSPVSQYASVSINTSISKASPSIATKSQSSTCRLTPSTVASAPIGDRFIPHRLSTPRQLFSKTTKKHNSEDDDDDNHDRASQIEIESYTHRIRHDYNQHLSGALFGEDITSSGREPQRHDGNGSSGGGILSNVTKKQSHQNNNNNDTTNLAIHNTLRAIPTLAGPYATRTNGGHLDAFMTGRSNNKRNLELSSSSYSNTAYRLIPNNAIKTLDAPGMYSYGFC